MTASNATSTANDTSRQQDPEVIVYCDGAGSRPDGKGSGFAWIIPETREQHIERVDGLTNNQAEYRALISALTAIPHGSVARVFTDSQLVWSQVAGNYRAHDPALSDLLDQVRTLIKDRHLKIDLQWVPRSKNVAGKLL